MEIGDPEEPEILGPSWARDSGAQSDYLRSLHFDYVKIAKSADLRYIPDSIICREGDLVAWKSVSPSQIENYDKCKRLWFFKSILKLPEMQKGNQALGSAFHRISEVMENAPEGQLPRAGYEYNHTDIKLDTSGWTIAETLASLVVPMVPRSKRGITVLRETKITLPTYENGPVMIGYIDLGIPPGLGWPALLIPETAAIVGDYKTLSDFRYMKTPEELANSVQMMTYAKWAIEDGPGLVPFASDNLWPLPTEIPEKTVALAHLYARTKPPFGKNSIRNSVAYVTETQINAKWEKTLDTVREMDQSALVADAQDIEPTGVVNNHCGAYGGCAFRDRCGLNAPNPVANLFSVNKTKSQASPTEPTDMSTTGGSSILQKINAARAAQAAGQAASAEPATSPQAAPVAAPSVAAPVAPEPATVAPAAPVAAPSKGPISALMAEIESKNGGARPALAGLTALLYSKEQGLSISPGAGLAGSGALAGTTCKTMADLVSLLAKPQAAPAATPSGIVPHDAPPREQPVITKPGDGVDPIKANAAGSAESVETVDTSEEPGEESGETASQPETAGNPEPGTKKRGRPTNAELEARRAEERAQVEAEIERRVSERMGHAGPVGDTGAVQIAAYTKTIAETGAKLAAVSKLQQAETERADRAVMERDSLKAKINAQMSGGAVEPAKPGFTLYVDTYPVKGKSEATVDYLEWYAPIASAIATANGVGDWRLIDYKGKGILATFMREAIKEGLPAAMTISSNGPGADVALEVLSPFARQIIRRM